MYIYKHFFMDKLYKRPTCAIFTTCIDFPLLAGSEGLGKGSPRHGGEDNLAKPDPFEHDQSLEDQTWNDEL